MSDNSDPHARAHAKLSASGAKRWMKCPGSIAYIDALPQSRRERSSEAAALGTAAHTLVEACLRVGYVSAKPFHMHWVCPDGTIETAKRDEDAHQVDYDMIDAVDLMLDVVRQEQERLGPQAELSIERRFDLTWLRPNMFGTNDVSLSLFLDELVVIDYKHGQGVPVEVAEEPEGEEGGSLKPNPQLAYYGLGAARAYDFTHAKVTLIVVQPRCPHPHGGVRRFEMTMAELLEFRDGLAHAADVVQQATDARPVAVAMGEEAGWNAKYLHAGDHCRTTFCARQAECAVLRDRIFEEAGLDFAGDPFDESVHVDDSDERELARMLDWVPRLDSWARQVKKTAHRLMLQGTAIPGYKVVRKRANRRWVVDEDLVAARLLQAGCLPKDFLTPQKLKSPAEVEKLGPEAKKLVKGHKLPRDEAWQVEPAAEKGEGGLTLAPASDPRKEVAVEPGSDFADEPVDDGASDE